MGRISAVILRLATIWTFRGSKPSGNEILRTRPDRPWVPPNLLYNGYRISFPEVKRPGRGLNHPPLSRAEVKERVELYFSSPSVPSWNVTNWTLPFSVIRQTALRFGAQTRGGGGVVRGASYTQAGGGGGRQGLTLLEGSQASSARPSGKNIMKWKWMKQKIWRKEERKKESNVLK
jgi:hypothetical protein